MEKTKDTSGSPDATSGATEENKQSYPPEFVEKLKKEKANLAKALEEAKVSLKEKESGELKEKEQWKTLYEQTVKSNEELSINLKKKDEMIQQGVLNAAISNELLKLGVDPSKMDVAKQLFDKSTIMFDETNTPIGVTEAAQSFYKKFADLNIFKKATTANHTAATMNGATVMDWKKGTTPEEKIKLFKESRK